MVLEEIAGGCRGGAGGVARGAPPPEPGAQNPALAEPASASWPAPPSGQRYEAVREAADLVRAAMADPRAGRKRARPRGEQAGARGPLDTRAPPPTAACEPGITLLLAAPDPR